MTSSGTALLIALAAASTVAFATETVARPRTAHHYGRYHARVGPPIAGDYWTYSWYGAWRPAAYYPRALPTTVYPYGPRGDGVRGWWYPSYIYGCCVTPYRRWR